VTRHLPGFQLYDPHVTRELIVRDLLTHRSGLRRADLLWYGSLYDRDDVLRRVRHIKPTWSFRSRFGYQNIMYLAAGQIVPAVTGDSWDDFVRRRIFTPLGMTAS
jgi:CubicO group peptidase (beta-lactamase class C family)